MKIIDYIKNQPDILLIKISENGVLMLHSSFNGIHQLEMGLLYLAEGMNLNEERRIKYIDYSKAVADFVHKCEVE